MKQQILELPVVEVANMPLNGKSTKSVLVRLWDETERAIAAQRPPSPPIHRTNLVEKRTRVSYAYD